MNKIYVVNLNKNINDIKIVKELKKTTHRIFLFFDENILDNNKKNELTKLPITELKQDEEITIAMDGKRIENQKNKYLHRIKKIKTKVTPKEIQILIFNYNENEEKDIIDLIQAIKVQFLSSIEDRYDYIYDNVCNYLDNRFICDNICDFKNNRCIAKRDYNLTCGCCRHYESLFSTKLVQCEHLKEKKCAAHCITCKLFTCDYIIKNKGIRFRIEDIFLLKYYFNFIQKLILLTSFFTTKEKIMKRLLIWR